MCYRDYDKLTPLEKRLYDPLEWNITFNKRGLDLKWASLKSTARHNRRILRKKEKRKQKGQAQSVGALTTREKDTIKSDSGADCRECYKKSSTTACSARLGEGRDVLGGVLAGRRGRQGCKQASIPWALTEDANVKLHELFLSYSKLQPFRHLGKET